MAKTNHELEAKELRSQLDAANRRIAELESKLADAPNRHLAEGLTHHADKKKLDTKHPHA